MNAKQNQCILVVEDDPFLQNLYRKVLECEGFKIVTANDGAAAVAMLPVLSASLVVLDLMLPKLDGLKVLEAIRATIRLKDLPVLILSNAYLPEVARKAMQAGATSGILKSECSPKQLGKIVCQLLKFPRNGSPTNVDSSWFASFIRRKTKEAGGDQAQAGPGENAALENAVSSNTTAREIQNELSNTWPTDVSLIRRSCLLYAKSTSSQTAEEHLKDLYRRLRFLSLRAAMADWGEISRLTAALEAMLFEHGFNPNRNMSQSVLQTLLQAVDCLGQMFQSARRTPIRNLPRTRVLLVDDDPVCNRANDLALLRANFETACAGDGAAALALLENNSYDLILLDIDMPVLNGFEVCKKIRKLRSAGETPVIFVTIQDDFKSRTQSALSGGNGFIAKPISPPELIAKALVFLFRHQSRKHSKGRPAIDKTAASASAPVPAKQNSDAVQPGAEGRDNGLHVAQAAVDNRVNDLLKALAAERQRREEAERAVHEHVRRQSKLEHAQADNQKAFEQIGRMVDELDQQSPHGGGSLIPSADGRARALRSVRDFVEDRSRCLDRELAAQAKRSEAARQEASACAKRMSEYEATLTALQQAKDKLLREIGTASDGKLRAELETALAENQAAQTSVLQKMHATRQESRDAAGPAPAADQTMEITAARSELAKLKAEQSRLTEQAETVTKTLATESGRRSEAEREIDELKQRRAELERALAADCQKELQLRTQLAEQQRQIDLQIQAHDAEMQTQAAKEKELETSRTELARLITEHEQAAGKVANLEQLLAVESGRRSGAERQAMEMKQRHDGLEQTLAVSRQQEAQLRDQLAEQQQRLDEQTQARHMEQEHLAARTRDLAGLQSELANLKEGHAQASARVASLTESLVTESARRATAEQQATQLATQARELTSRRRELEQELAANSKQETWLRAQLAEQQQQLAVQISERRDEVERLTGQAMKLETAKLELAERRAELEGELAGSQQREAQLRTELAARQQQLDAQVKAHQAEVKRRDGQAKELEQTRQKFAARLSATQTLLSKSEGAVHQLEKELQARQAAYARLEQEYQAGTALQLQLSAQIEEARAQSAETAAGLNQKFFVAEQGWKNREHELGERIHQLQQELAMLGTTLARREAELKNDRETIQELQALHSSLLVKVRELTDQTHQLTSSLASESERKAVAEKTAADLSARRVELEQRLAESSQQVTRLRAEQSEQQQRLDAEVQAGQSEISRLAGQVKELETTRADLMENVQTLTDSLAVESGRRTAAEQKESESAARGAELELQLAVGSKTEARLRAELAGHQEQLAALALAHETGVARLAEVSKELEAARAEFAQLKSAHARGIADAQALTESLAVESSRHASVEQAWKERETGLENRLSFQAQDLAVAKAVVVSQETEIENSRAKTDELLLLQSALCAKVRSLTERGKSAANWIRDLRANAVRSAKARESSRRELARMRFAVLDASRMSVRLNREWLQKEKQDLHAIGQLLVSLAQTPLSLVQRAMLVDIQDAMAGLKTRPGGMRTILPCAAELSGFRRSTFRFDEIAGSAFRDIRSAAEAAGVPVQLSASGNTSGRMSGYPEQVHQLMTLLAVSPLGIVRDISALDVRVAVKPRNSCVAEMTLRIALVTAAEPRTLRRCLFNGEGDFSSRTASFNEAELALAAGWQLARAMGAQAGFESDGRNEKCLMVSLPLELGALLPANAGSRHNPHGDDPRNET